MEDNRTKIEKTGRKISNVLEMNPPDAFVFRSQSGAPAKEATVNLELTNKTDSHVAFKIKTTRPKSYCVRPNSGCIEPRGQTTVQVILQSFDKLKEEHAKHKFQVQAISLDGGPVSTDELSTLFSSTPASSIFEGKLRCVWKNFILPNGESFSTGTSAQSSNLPPVPESPAKAPQVAGNKNVSTGPVTTQRRMDAAQARAERSTSAASDVSTAPQAPSTSMVSGKPSASGSSVSAKNEAHGTAATTVSKPQSPGNSLEMLLVLVAFILGILFDRFVLQ